MVVFLPPLELLERVTVDDPRRVYDLGCGVGEIARIMAERARAYAAAAPPLEWDGVYTATTK